MAEATRKKQLSIVLTLTEDEATALYALLDQNVDFLNGRGPTLDEIHTALWDLGLNEGDLYSEYDEDSAVITLRSVADDDEEDDAYCDECDEDDEEDLEQ